MNNNQALSAFPTIGDYDRVPIHSVSWRGQVSSHVLKNLLIFNGLTADLHKSLGVSAASPYSEIYCAPVSHFGIDSDPWMHAIKYCDRGRSFFVICQGLTHCSMLGAVILPDQKLILENRESWYFLDVYNCRIERNLPRVLAYYGDPLYRDQERQGGKLSHVAVAIGNQRVGDFFMQLLWMHKLLSDHQNSLAIDKVFVNQQSEFLNVEKIFPELGCRIERLPSITHIEYRARDLDYPLISDVIPLSDSRALDGVRSRIFLSLEHDDCLISSELENCQLVVWLSVEIEKRVWVEQRRGLAELINWLCITHLRDGDRIGIIFNGLTGLDSGIMSSTLCNDSELELRIIHDVLDLVRYPYRVVHAYGRSLRDKAHLCREVGLLIAPAGSASVLPSLIFSLPGVVYGLDIETWLPFIGWNTVAVPEHCVCISEMAGTVDWGASSCRSYSCEPGVIIDLINRSFDAERVSGKVVFNRRSMS
jgi:hypothetical protein